VYEIRAFHFSLSQIPILLDDENRSYPAVPSTSTKTLVSGFRFIRSPLIWLQIFIRFDGTELDMVTLKGSRSNPVGYALRAVDSLFKNKSDLVNTLDPRTADDDDRIRAINGTYLSCLTPRE
jgi:hypothetical protein